MEVEPFQRIPAQHRRRHRRLLWGAVVVVAAVVVLAIPCPSGPVPRPARGGAFIWRQDERWRALEERFRATRQRGCTAATDDIASGLGRVRSGLEALAANPDSGPGDAALIDLETAMFAVGAEVAACPATLPEYAEVVSEVRRLVKRISRGWDAGSKPARDRLYRLLYGGRTALEQAMLQAPAGRLPAAMIEDDEGSATAATEVLGVRVHSGDILVSRGGAATSALIARGSDYPGNFSHVALLHVDSTTGVGSVIEAHIERGVVVSSLAAYLADVKLRLMVVRVRSDLPAMLADPQLPQRAADWALAQARTRHIPYNFSMDPESTAGMFCSQVASRAYRQVGIRLWQARSRISSPGTARWLHFFGVTHFETEEPSDIEADPQVVVVAEWRDPDTLFRDQVDNAVTEVMLEGAEAGREIGISPLLLPVARLAKGLSLVMNEIGRTGPVPEGMSAMAALRNRAYTAMHRNVAQRTAELAAAFQRGNGYRPPYWELVRLARQAAIGLR